MPLIKCLRRDILQTIRGNPDPMTYADLVRKSGYGRSTVYRCLKGLKQSGDVMAIKGETYRGGYRYEVNKTLVK